MCSLFEEQCFTCVSIEKHRCIYLKHTYTIQMRYLPRNNRNCVLYTVYRIRTSRTIGWIDSDIHVIGTERSSFNFSHTLSSFLSLLSYSCVIILTTLKCIRSDRLFFFPYLTIRSRDEQEKRKKVSVCNRAARR